MERTNNGFTCCIQEKKCHKCGKIFIPGAEHIYRDHGKWYCRWTCYLHRKDKEPLRVSGSPPKEEFSIPRLNPFKKQSQGGLTPMTKEQLRHYRSIAREIDQLEERMIRLEMKGHNDDVTKPLRDLYRKKLKTLIEGQLKIEEAIESLNPTERELMRLRYIDGEEWVDISAMIHYEWAQTHRIHAKALNKIKNL